VHPHAAGLFGPSRPAADEANYPPRLGWTPWSAQGTFVLDTAAATALGVDGCEPIPRPQRLCANGW